MSNPKHMGLLEIKGKAFRLTPTRLAQIRPFLYGDISLNDIQDLTPQDPKVEEKITKVLSLEIKKLIAEAKKQQSELAPLDAETLYRIRSPDQVLVRLKVEYAGFPTLNSNRFGALFVGKVANPSDMVLFSKKKRDAGRAVEGGRRAEAQEDEPEDDAEDDINKIKIDDLVRDSLRNSKKPLGVLIETSLTQALDDYIVKKDANAIVDLVKDTLDETRKALLGDAEADSKEKMVERVSRHKKITEESILKGERAPVARGERRIVYDDDDGAVNVDSDDDAPVGKKAPAKPKAAAKAPKTAAAKAPKAKAPAKAKAVAKSRAKDDDDEDDDEVAEKPQAARRGTARAAAVKRKVYAEEDDDEGDEVEESEDEAVFEEDSDEELKRPPAKVAAKSSTANRAKASPAPRAVLNTKPLSFAKPSQRSEVIEIDDDDEVMPTNRTELSIKLPSSQSGAGEKKRALPFFGSSSQAGGSQAKKPSVTNKWS